MTEFEEFQIPEMTHEIFNDPLKLHREMQSGKSLQEIIGYSDQIMDSFYGAACRLFAKQNYEESSDAFIFLTTINPFVSVYWLGLGMSEHLVGEYSGALFAYKMAISIDKSNPVPYYHSAACYRAVYDIDSAIDCLQKVINKSADIKKHENIKKQATQAKAALLREMENENLEE